MGRTRQGPVAVVAPKEQPPPETLRQKDRKGIRQLWKAASDRKGRDLPKE